MLYSLLIKLGMVALTAGVVFWVGWTVPQSRVAEADPRLVLEKLIESSAESRETPSKEVALKPPSVREMVTPSAAVRVHKGKLDLNRASEQDIEGLPGIGPVLAERIIAYRDSRGGFRQVEQLRDVKGIGKKKFERIRLLVDVVPSTDPSRGLKRTT